MIKQKSDKTIVQLNFSPLYVLIAGLFVCCLMIANITAPRLVQIWGFTTNGDLFLFPLTYIFGDILTEVYGFKKTRLVIWIGFLANILMAGYFWLMLQLPYPAEYVDNAAYSLVLGMTPRIVLASVIAFFFGEYANSVVMSVMKKVTKGRWLAVRTISSTLIGQLVDTVLFMTIALTFLPVSELISIIGVAYGVKVLYEILATPLTYIIVNKVKNMEAVDTYDYGVKYIPIG